MDSRAELFLETATRGWRQTTEVDPEGGDRLILHDIVNCVDYKHLLQRDVIVTSVHYTAYIIYVALTTVASVTNYNVSFVTRDVNKSRQVESTSTNTFSYSPRYVNPFIALNKFPRTFSDRSVRSFLRHL